VASRVHGREQDGGGVLQGCGGIKISKPQLQYMMFVMILAQGGQFPRWHRSAQAWPQGESFFWHGREQVWAGQFGAEAVRSGQQMTSHSCFPHDIFALQRLVHL
jgi:hypothetical protein